MMNNEQIPEECLGDSQFVMTFIATICKEISRKEDIMSDAENSIAKKREAFSTGAKERASLKLMIQAEREKRILLEPVLQSLKTTENPLTTELALLSQKLDDRSLGDKAYLKKYADIVEMYKTTWLRRQPEYEKIPAAVERYKKRIEFQLVHIELMVLEQQRMEYEKRVRQKEGIDKIRLMKRTAKMVEKVQDRLEKQRKRAELNERSLQLKSQVEAMIKQKKELLKLREEEERSKLRAKQLMPPPKLDLTFMRSFYTTSRLHREGETEENRSSRFSTDSDDNISITTEILEDLCKNDDQMMETAEGTDQEVKSISQSASILLKNQTSQTKNNNNDSESVEVLEKTYRQLSLEKDNALDDSSPMEVHAVIENSKKKKTSPLKLQSLLRKAANELEGSPRIKRYRVGEIKERKCEERMSLNECNASEICQENRPIQENHGTTEEPEQQLPKKGSSNCRQLPTIQSVETMTRLVTIGAKPLVAEVPPTPSNLFSPRHYATSSFGSIDPYDSAFKSNLDDASISESLLNNKVNMDFTGPINWENFSPPAALQSESSFTSNISVFKTADDNSGAQQFESTADNFVTIFGGGTKGTAYFLGK